MEILGEEMIYRGRKISLKKVFLKIRGKTTFHEVVLFGQAVAILPFKGNNIVLLKQYRSPVGGWIYEIPAGKIEEGESPEETCVRELIEETGYKPNYLEKLISVYTTPGYSNEVLHIFLARDLKFVGQRLTDYEIIKTIEIPYTELLQKIRNGEIIDGKTIIAVLYYELFKRHKDKTL